MLPPHFPGCGGKGTCGGSHDYISTIRIAKAWSHVVGSAEDIAKYTALEARVVSAFNAAYYTSGPNTRHHIDSNGSHGNSYGNSDSDGNNHGNSGGNSGGNGGGIEAGGGSTLGSNRGGGTLGGSSAGVGKPQPKGGYTCSSTTPQTANALGLQVAPGSRAAVEALLADIVAKDSHLDTGIVGTKWLFESLAQSGRADVALQIITNPTYPG